MKPIYQNTILYVAILISLATYMFWDLMPKNSFYVGNALFIFLLSAYIFILRKNFGTFFLISVSANNLLDELFFDPTKIGYSELILIIVIPIIYAIYERRKTRNL